MRDSIYSTEYALIKIYAYLLYSTKSRRDLDFFTGFISKMSLDSSAALQTVQAFMDGIANHDPDSMIALTLPNGSATLSRPPQTLHMKLPQLVNRIPFSERKIEERIHDTQVMVDGDIAMVWAPYEALIDDKVHHIGTNIFSLLKRDGKWVISCLADTSRPA